MGALEILLILIAVVVAAGFLSILIMICVKTEHNPEPEVINPRLEAMAQTYQPKEYVYMNQEGELTACRIKPEVFLSYWEDLEYLGEL